MPCAVEPPLTLLAEAAGEDASTARYPIKKRPEHLSAFHVMPFTHLVYSVTWYSLSAAAAVGTYIRFR